MPQMAPMWWEILFLMFMMMFFVTNCMLFWGINSDMSGSQENKYTKKTMNWKW